MCPDGSFQTMTSYLEGVANNGRLAGDTSSLVHASHTSSRLPTQPHHSYGSPFAQDSYINPSTAHSMQRSHARAPQRSQHRIHDHDDPPDGGMEFQYPTHPRSQPSYQSRSSHHSIDQYSASLHPPSLGSSHHKLDPHLTIESLPSENYQQTRPDASLLDYREALRDYHTTQSTIIEQQHRQHDFSRDDHNHSVHRGRHESPPSYGNDMKETDERPASYQEGLRLPTSSSSISMSNYPPSPPSTGHGLPRYLGSQNVNLRPNELEDAHGLPDSSRHNQRHQGQVDITINDEMTSLTNSQYERHPRSRPTAGTQSHSYHFNRDTSPSSSYYQQQQHQNLPAHARSRHSHHGRSSFSYHEHIDTHIMVNEDRQLGESYNYSVDLDSNSQSSSIPSGLPGQVDGQVDRSRSDDTLARNSPSAMIASVTASTTSDPGQGQIFVKKKKKSKMHECEICQKKFPRPSGLKTHMNIHNNEKPFPCGFPGCERTFGVRSNAKRHLRTHGVNPAAMAPGQPPYVVGFETPVVLPDQHPDMRHDGQASGASNSKPPDFGDHDRIGPDGVDEDHDQLEEDIEGRPGGGRIPMYKVRWMPPSVTSRTNIAATVGAFQDREQPIMEGADADRNRFLEDPYRLNLRHDYEHAPGHGENTYRHRHAHEHSRHAHPYSRHDSKGKERWRDDGPYPSDGGIDHDLHPRPPSFDAESPSSSLVTPSGSRAKSSSISSTCICSPPCPMDSSGNVSCRMRSVYPESNPRRQYSGSNSPPPATAFYHTRTPGSTHSTSYNDISRKPKDQHTDILHPKLEKGHSYHHQTGSHPYDSVQPEHSPSDNQ